MLSLILLDIKVKQVQRIKQDKYHDLAQDFMYQSGKALRNYIWQVLGIFPMCPTFEKSDTFKISLRKNK